MRFVLATIAAALIALGTMTACTADTGSTVEQDSPVSTPPATWTTAPFTADFTATQSSPTNGFFAGQGLDVAFDKTGAAWGIGEFAMHATRAQGSTATTHQLPLKSYGNWQWTKPFRSLLNGGQHSESSDLGESVIVASGAVWFAQGGGQQAGLTDNHSILTRMSTTAPYAACQIPIPGDNQHLIGLAHDTKRNRIWFATSEGPDGSKLGWVKASGLGTRCQNGLDYGGNPALTVEENDTLRASAQVTVNSLRCTPTQDLSAATNCVHMVDVSMPTGAAHLAYDVAGDALWMTNWADRKLRRFEPATGVLTGYPAPSSPYTGPTFFGATPWQIAANATHVFVNEYAGHRLLAFDKAAGTWSAIDVPLDLLGVDPLDVQTHSLTLRGDSLWFTVANEGSSAGVAAKASLSGANSVGEGRTAAGRVSLSSWAAGSPQATLYTFDSLPGSHSFRGIDVNAAGQIALADAPDHATVVLTPRSTR